MSEDEDIAALREQTSQGDRIDEATAQEDKQAFVDDDLTELEAIEAGDQQKTVSVWDGKVAAFIRALEENPDRLERVGDGLQKKLEVDAANEIDRSDILRLALRLGFQEAAPAEFDAVREAVREQAAKRL